MIRGFLTTETYLICIKLIITYHEILLKVKLTAACFSMIETHENFEARTF